MWTLLLLIPGLSLPLSLQVADIHVDLIRAVVKLATFGQIRINLDSHGEKNHPPKKTTTLEGFQTSAQKRPKTEIARVGRDRII